MEAKAEEINQVNNNNTEAAVVEKSKSISPETKTDVLFKFGEGFRYKEELIKSKDGDEVYHKIWLPEDETVKVIANVVFVHGFAEHINRYDHVFKAFAKEGIVTYSFDQTGHGKTAEIDKSYGKGKGLIRLVNDVDAIIERNKLICETPLILYGHSWGGGSALNYLALGKHRLSINGCISTSPFLKLAKESMPNLLLVKILIGVSYLLPSATYTVDVIPKYISRDEKEVNKYLNREHSFDKATFLHARNMIVEGEAFESKRYKDIRVPRLLLAHGTQDKVTDFNTTKEVYQKIKKFHPKMDVRFDEYKDAYHELHNDLCKDELINSITQWIKETANNSKASSPNKSMSPKL